MQSLFLALWISFLHVCIQGMEYLEQKRLVHRNLAARTVLVMNEDNVKISSFEMSRAIGAGNEYYTVGAHFSRTLNTA